MPQLPQAIAEANTNNPLAPSDAPFQASTSLAGLLGFLIQFSQKNQLKGLDISRSLPSSTGEAAADNLEHIAFLAESWSYANIPQGKVENILPQARSDGFSFMSDGYAFDQGDFTAFGYSMAFNPKREIIKSLTSSQVEASSNDIVGGLVFDETLPNAESEANTNLFMHSKTNRLEQAFAEGSTFPLVPPSKMGKVPNSTVNAITNLFSIVHWKRFFDSTVNDRRTTGNRLSGLIYKSDGHNYWNNNTYNFSSPYPRIYYGTGVDNYVTLRSISYYEEYYDEETPSDYSFTLNFSSSFTMPSSSGLSIVVSRYPSSSSYFTLTSYRTRVLSNLSFIITESQVYGTLSGGDCRVALVDRNSSDIDMTNRLIKIT